MERKWNLLFRQNQIYLGSIMENQMEWKRGLLWQFSIVYKMFCKKEPMSTH